MLEIIVQVNDVSVHCHLKRRRRIYDRQRVFSDEHFKNLTNAA